MDTAFISGVLSLISLLLISGLTYVFSKKHNMPYTVLLALVGILLIPILKIPFFSYLDDFKLTPEILFFVFLPVLIFESGYNIKYRKLMQNWKSIGFLAVFGLLISALLIGVIMHYAFMFIGWDIPLSICLLFGSLISATDPVAVLSLFKDVGAPRRLSLIFEGESLFNDGTALALFLVMLEIIDKGVVNAHTVFGGFFVFVSMIVGGIIFGGLLGYLFSLIIGKIKNNELVEISFTMVLAHLVFLLSELISEHFIIGGMEIKISGVIATSVAAILMGNYGRYKITPKVEKYMEKFWSFFAFISNSLVFILLGLILNGIDIDYPLFLIPVVIIIAIVAFSRSISVYIPIWFINKFKLEEPIPGTWQKLLAWGSLRGGLALMMVFMIPDSFHVSGWTYSFTPKDFLLVITIGCIFFTLFLKAPTIGPMIKKYGLNSLNSLEIIEKYESEIMIYMNMINKINSINSRGHLNIDEYSSLINKYESMLNQSITNLNNFVKNEKDSIELVKKAVLFHALGIEKQYLTHMYEYNEVNEDIFRYLITKIERQIYRIENGLPQLRTEKERQTDKIKQGFFGPFKKFFGVFNEESILESFIRYRAQAIISNKVVIGLSELLELEFGYDKILIQEVIEVYKNFNLLAEDKLKKIYQYEPELSKILNTSLLEKHLMNLEEKIVKGLHEKEMISPKLYTNFLEQIDEQIYKIVKTEEKIYYK